MGEKSPINSLLKVSEKSYLSMVIQTLCDILKIAFENRKACTFGQNKQSMVFNKYFIH